MSFQITALDPAPFASLFHLSDNALAARHIQRHTAAPGDGMPCRVSLHEAEPGETVLLLNYTHQPACSPYQSAHAIYVRHGARQAVVAPGMWQK